MCHRKRWLIPANNRIIWKSILESWYSGVFFKEIIGNMICVSRYPKRKQSRFWPKSVRLHPQCNLISKSNEADDFTVMLSSYIAGPFRCNLIPLHQKPLYLHFGYRVTHIMVPIVSQKSVRILGFQNSINFWGIWLLSGVNQRFMWLLYPIHYVYMGPMGFWLIFVLIFLI